MPRIQDSKGRLNVTIPGQICKIKDWVKGTELFFQFDDKGRVVVEEAKKI